MRKSYCVYSSDFFLGVFTSLYQAKSACFKDFYRNKVKSYYTIFCYNHDKDVFTKVHYSCIQFYHPYPDVRFPEFVLDYGKTDYHHLSDDVPGPFVFL